MTAHSVNGLLRPWSLLVYLDCIKCKGKDSLETIAVGNPSATGATDHFTIVGGGGKRKRVM